MGSEQLTHPAMALDEVDDGRAFNQFAGKKSTYKEELYTTKLDFNRVTSE
jgi:hypothetical protein